MSRTDSKARNRFEFVAKYKTRDIAFGIKYAGVSANYIFFDENVLDQSGAIDISKMPVYESASSDTDYTLTAKGRSLAVKRDRYLQSGIFRGDGVDDVALVWDESLLDVNHDSWTSPYAGFISIPCILMKEDGTLALDDVAFTNAASELRYDYSEVKTDTDEPITDARPKMIQDFISTLRLLTLSLRFTKLTVEPLTIINEAYPNQLINILFTTAQKFYKSAVAAGKMFTFPSPKNNSDYELPYKVVDHETGDWNLTQRSMHAVYSISMKDFLTYLTPMLKHACGAYNGAAAIFTIPGSSDQSKVAYEGKTKGINSNIVHAADRMTFTTDDDSKSWIMTIAGDVIILETSDRSKFNVGPAVGVSLINDTYYELRSYRPSIIMIDTDVKYALFNNMYDSPVLIATKHELHDQTFTFTGDSLIRLVEGKVVDVDKYEFQLNDLVKVKLDDIADSYYTSNEIIKVRTNGSLLDIVDANYFPIAAGDFSTVAVDLRITRTEGIVSSISITFDQDVYVNSLQVPFKATYNFDVVNHALYVDMSACGCLTDLLNGTLNYSDIYAMLYNYATQFARPTFTATSVSDSYIDQIVIRTNFSVSASLNWEDIAEFATGIADDAGYRDEDEGYNAAWSGDHMNVFYYFSCSSGTFGFTYNVDEGTNLNTNVPSAYYKLDSENHTFTEISFSNFDEVVHSLDSVPQLLCRFIYDQNMWDEEGSSIVAWMRSRRSDATLIGYTVGRPSNVLWYVEGYNPSSQPIIGNEISHTHTTATNSVSADIENLGELLTSCKMYMNFIPSAKTVDYIDISKPDDNLCIGNHFTSNYFEIGYKRELVERGYIETVTDWSLTIRNSLQLAVIRRLFSEEDVQYISTHCMNVFMNRTGIAEIVASYVSPNLSEISPTLLADAQTFLQSSMRDSIEATLMAIEDVTLNEENVTNVDDLTSDDNDRLVYYVNKLGKISKGLIADVKDDIQEGSDVLDVDAVASDEHLISVPRMDEDGHLVFDAPCSLEDIPTTINDGEEEVPLLHALLKSKLSAHKDEINPSETEAVDQNVSDYVTNLINIYGDYTATVIESDMTDVVDQIAESNPDIELSDATAIIESKADQVKAEITTDPVVIDAIEKTKTISSRLQTKVAEAAAKAKISTVAIVTDAYAKFGKISNGISTKVSAWASKLYSVANDIGQSVIKMFGTNTEITKDNWNGSGNITNRSNLSLAFDINFPDMDVVGAAKAAVGVVASVAEKIYDKIANYVRKTFKDGVSFKTNESGYETLDCPAYCEVMTLAEFKAIYGSLASYIEAYREQTKLENITFVTQLNTEIIFIQLHADNYVKIICNPLIDIEDTKDIKLDSDLDFLDRMLAAIERAANEYNFVADKLNDLYSTLESKYRNLANEATAFARVEFDRTKQYEIVFKGAKVSTKEKKAKGWKVFGWITAAVGAVLCCTGIGTAAGAAMMVGGAALFATGYAVEKSGMSKELEKVIKKAREDTAFANAEITSAELLGVWNSCPVEIGQLYLFCLPIVFEGGYVHPGNGKLLKDGRYVPCAIFAGFPALKYSLVTDDERARQTRRGLLTIAAVVIGTLVAARLATRKIRAKRKYKQICAEQWALENPDRETKFDAKGNISKWYKEDPNHPGDEDYFVFDQAAFDKAKAKYFKRQEKLAWKSYKKSNILGGSGGAPDPSYDGGADFDELSAVIGYKRTSKKK